jgi:hypothetical protein
VRLHRLVEQVTAVSLRVRRCDREPEPAPAGVGTRGLAAREALEELRDEVGRDAAASILDADSEMAVTVLGADEDGRLAVPQGIDDEVGDDPV